MNDISINYNSKADRERQISHVIIYPDGVQRILTMKRYQWDWFNYAAQNGYEFDDILRVSIQLAREFPLGKGYQNDVLYCTVDMLQTIISMIYENKSNAANDRTLKS